MEEFETQTKKILYCHERIIRFWGWLRRKIARKETSVFLHVYCHEQNVERNVEGHFAEFLEGYEEQVIGNWKRGHLCY